jgi:hypothetical protein
MSRFATAFIFALTITGCTSPESTSTTTAALQCFHGENAVTCKPASGSLEERTKVEDFYPSACFDGDADQDGTPDFLDLDFLGSAEAEAAVARDDLRCPRCNRGPGTQNDFRLRIEGTSAELDRGKVYVRAGNQLMVPTPEGVLEIAITATTRIDDGEPAPGAEIRVEGTIVNGVLEATRLKVLCPAPAAMPPGETPPDTDEPQPEPGTPLF